MKVLLTGATGFLGGHTVTELLGRGWQVRAFARHSSKTAHLEARGIEIFRGDLLDAGDLTSALAGVDAVVHAAGGGQHLRVADVYENNRDTTIRLVEAALAGSSPLRRFVLVSSLAAHGPSPDGAPRPAAAPPSPQSHYGRSKAEAERVVLERASALPVSVLRPPAVYGPGDTRMLPIFQAVGRGLLPTIGRGRTVSIVYGPDCARAIADLVAVEHESGGVFPICDGGSHRWDEVVDAIAAAFGRRRPLKLPVPVGLLRLAATINEARARRAGRAVPFTRDKVRDLAHRHWVCESADLERAIGWRPRVALVEGMATTLSAYREAGWL